MTDQALCESCYLFLLAIGFRCSVRYIEILKYFGLFMGIRYLFRGEKYDETVLSCFFKGLHSKRKELFPFRVDTFSDGVDVQ